jgi:hypothetical protein
MVSNENEKCPGDRLDIIITEREMSPASMRNQPKEEIVSSRIT